MKAHDLPRPYRLAIPPEVVWKIDALRSQGFSYEAIGKALNIHWRTISKADKRRDGYKLIPKGVNHE